MRFLIFLLFLVGCTNDPFDPVIGPRNPRAGAERYLQARTDIQQEQKKAFLDSQQCPVEVLRALSTAPSREVRALVAANPSTDPPLFEKLIHDPEPAVRQYVALNPNAPHAILIELKKDPNQNVRWGLPGNPNWSSEEIRQMYENKVTSPEIFARNPSTPIRILEELANSENYNVRTSLANNPSINETIVKRLAQNGNPSVRLMLTYNKATSLEVLQSLTKDSDENVRRYAVDWLRRRSAGSN